MGDLVIEFPNPDYTKEFYGENKKKKSNTTNTGKKLGKEETLTND